jgi:predicted MPP superfamily phosphohydrolase
VKLLTAGCIAAYAAISLAILAALYHHGWSRTPASPAVTSVLWSYIIFCSVVCVVSIVQRWHWARHPELGRALVSNHTKHVRLSGEPIQLAAAGISRLLARLPGNQVLDVRIQEKELIIPRLGEAHDGLRIAHVTDLHMSGRIERAFFERIVDEVNRQSPDIVAITGDIIECDQYLDWIRPTLGQLRAQHGVYYVLGNHDRRATESRLKAAMADAGLIHLGGSWQQIVVKNAPLVLAGNEIPWYGPAADMRNCPQRDTSCGPTRILLAHSPDQFPWAGENDFDLMLAGHLHGGQVRLPVLGAFLAPSVYGVRYAAGTFTAGNTTMHVSRGVSSLTPVRYGCPPEVAILVLRKSK